MASKCPFCGNAPEDEEHILWHCTAWHTARTTHLPDVLDAAAHIPSLPPPDQWPPCLRCCGLAPEIPDDCIKSGRAYTFLNTLHTMFVAVLQARKVRDAQAPAVFPGTARSQQLRQYPYQQLVGPLPYSGEKDTLLLRTPKKHEWPWEMPFLADLLRWLRALTWTQEPGSVTFLELALDFEEFAERTLPHAPQAKFKGTTLSLQERGRVLRLAMNSVQRLVTKGQLHPARIVTRCSSLVPLGGPALCGLNCRPYFAGRNAMLFHIQKLAAYCEQLWSFKVGAHRVHAPRPYAYRPRRSAAEVESHRLHRALHGNLQTGLAPPSEQIMPAKGGGSNSSFGADFFPVIGDGRLPQRPYTGTRRHVSTHTTPHLAPRVDHSKCVAHTALACMTCKRLRKSAEECCKLGHHAASHVARRPQLQLCPLHNLPPCPRCTLKQRGVRHCCDRGHHKVCTPVPAHRKRTLPMQSLLPHKKPCLQRPARHS